MKLYSVVPSGTQTIVNTLKIPTTVKIVIGQGLWATAQALTIVVLAHAGSIELVGLYSFGLSVYAPACLVLGLNMRILVALDDEKAISLTPAILVRIAAVLVALLPTAALLFAVGKTEDAVVALVLLFGRIGDQVADVTSGFHQRHGDHGLIAKSWTIRGLASGLPFAVLSFLGVPLLLSAASSSLFSLLALVATDIRILNNHTSVHRHQTTRAFLSHVRASSQSALYPFLDSIFYNSLRYSFQILLSTQALGYLAIAQAMYTPVQMILTAFGYTFVSNARTAVTHASAERFKKLVVKGALFALSLSGLFMLFSFTVPASLLVLAFGERPDQVQYALILLSLSTFPLPFISIATMVCFATQNHKRPTFAALVSIAAFYSLLIASTYVWSDVRPLLIAVAFSMAGVLRLLVTTYRLGRLT